MTEIEQLCIEQTRKWIRSFVIRYNLCPFAKREMDKGSVRIQTSQATTTEQALLNLENEIELLNTKPETETSFLLFPWFLEDFFDYLDFTEMAESKFLNDKYNGIYQFATFHPDYCFADASFDDVTNYTNRSPYPMLHLLREDSLEKAIASFGNTGAIPEANIMRLRAMGLVDIEKIVADCLTVKEEGQGV